MAKQVGNIKIIGTIDNLTFYEMDGEFYVRMKSSLTGKQFKTKKCFERSRRSAARFGTGNKIAGEVYRSLPDKKRVYALFCSLKSIAIALLKQGLDEADAKITLEELLKPPRRKRLQRRLQRHTTERTANNYLPSKDIYPQPVSFTTKTKRIHGLVAEKARLYPTHSLPSMLQCNQIPDLRLRNHRPKEKNPNNYLVLSKRKFLIWHELFLQDLYYFPH